MKALDRFRWLDAGELLSFSATHGRTIHPGQSLPKSAFTHPVLLQSRQSLQLERQQRKTQGCMKLFRLVFIDMCH